MPFALARPLSTMVNRADVEAKRHLSLVPDLRGGISSFTKYDVICCVFYRYSFFPSIPSLIKVFIRNINDKS